MKRHFALFGALLALLISTGAGNALAGLDTYSSPPGDKPAIISGQPLSGRSPEQPFLLAQSEADNAVRIDQALESNRRLSGKVEELTFQLLQLQEQIRKMQEDFEFRFQELEEKRSDAGGGGRQKDPVVASIQGSGEQRLGKPLPSGDRVTPGSSGGTEGSSVTRQASKILGSMPQDLGTLSFDADGNVISSALGKPLDLTKAGEASTDPVGGGVDEADLEPALAVARARDYFDRGDYVLAEQTLEKMIVAYPENDHRPEAQYWLGRAQFARGQFRSAATVFLDTHNTYPDAERAADTLLRLGLAMAGLNQREIACATYGEVLKQYPDADETVKSQVAVERASAAC